MIVTEAAGGVFGLGQGSKHLLKMTAARKLIRPCHFTPVSQELRFSVSTILQRCQEVRNVGRMSRARLTAPSNGASHTDGRLGEGDLNPSASLAAVLAAVPREVCRRGAPEWEASTGAGSTPAGRPPPQHSLKLWYHYQARFCGCRQLALSQCIRGSEGNSGFE